MLKNARDVRIYGFVLVIVLAVFMFVSVLVSEEQRGEDYLYVNAYFLNPVTNTLEPEQRQIPKGTNEEMITELLLNVLGKGPENKALSRTIPENMTFTGGQLINQSLLQLEFSFADGSMTHEEELFFKSSLVWTMTELEIITDLHVYVNDRELLRSNGGPVGIMNRENIKINKPISPFVSDSYRVVLYFSDSEYSGLLPEERVIRVIRSSDEQQVEKYLVEQLIAGPSQPDHYATVPPETKIREVKTDGDICYVDLSSDAFTKNINADARLTIYSIVNSLTQLGNIKKVQFLVDSKKPETVKGGYDLSAPLERDESIIIVTE